MKKFCNKITKQQWRVTVPNINTFKKSIGKEEDKRISSGSYDLQLAEKEFDCRSREHRLELDTDSSDSEHDDTFEDARNGFEKSTDLLSTTPIPEDDCEIYTDVPNNREFSKTLTENNSKYEYDVPKISFNFFEKKQEENEVKFEQCDYENVEVKKTTCKSETKINLTAPEVESENEGYSSQVYVDTKNINVCLTKILEDFDSATIIKSGSDPNIPLRTIREEEDDDEDGLYKVPRPLARNRLSMSLNDFNSETVDTIISTHSSLDHLSCSQVLIDKPKTEPSPDNYDSRNSANLEYCKVRSKLPLRLRRVTFLRKPKNKALDTWNDIKLKMNKVLSEPSSPGHAIHNIDKEKIASNLGEMYKSSKDKCRKMFKSTGKMFKSKKDQENLDPNCDSNSQIVKNDAFFAKMELKASDIQYKFDYQVDNKCCEKERSCVAIEGGYPLRKGVFNGLEKGCSIEGDCSEQNEISGGKEKICAVKEGNEYGNNICAKEESCVQDGIDKINGNCVNLSSKSTKSDGEKKEEFDFMNPKIVYRKSKSFSDGQNGFDDIRRYIKQGGDFCKELSAILQERSEAELQYAKSLSKLSSKLSKACREGVGGLNESWKAVALELESRAEGHRIIGTALLEEAAKPLRTLTENQHRTRKNIETFVDKASRNLADWRAAEAKSKKHSHTCARENEKLQDALLDNKLNRSTSLIQITHLHNNKPTSEKESAKLEGKKRKAEDAVKKADIEYYTLCVRSERARLEWESAVMKGASTFQTLEEERLNNLKTILNTYLQHSNQLGPRLIEAMEELQKPCEKAEPSKDLNTFISLRQSSQQISEQLLPDFYCEHITLAMNRERRKQALIKLLHLIKHDIERERKSKNGLENLSKAIKQTPSFGTDDSQQSVAEKLYHMKSMLTYLEGARYKIQSALAELDSRPRTGHPLAPHIIVTRDKSGLQQSVLKVPQWLREQWVDPHNSPLSEKSDKSQHDINITEPDWTDRGTADGNSNQPDSDFDEFSSQASSSEIMQSQEENPVQPIAQCKALYPYTPNLPDELSLQPGDILSVYRQQDDGWWLGECKGSVGIFPATYVETV